MSLTPPYIIFLCRCWGRSVGEYVGVTWVTALSADTRAKMRALTGGFWRRLQVNNMHKVCLINIWSFGKIFLERNSWVTRSLLSNAYFIVLLLATHNVILFRHPCGHCTPARQHRFVTFSSVRHYILFKDSPLAC